MLPPNQIAPSWIKLLSFARNYYPRQAKLFARSAEGSQPSPPTMLSSLRVLAWRVVDQTRRALLQQPIAIKTRPSNLHTKPEQETLNLSSQSQTGVKAIGKGGGRGPYQPKNHDTKLHSGPFVGLLGRLGPLVSGVVRRLIHPQNVSSFCFKDTAPLFALVGVTLLASEGNEEDGVHRKYKGFVTKEEELEAICSTIRQAAYHNAWLYDSPSSFLRSDLQMEEKNHLYSLQDLDLSGVIGKGCNAVVYGARWNNQVPEKTDEKFVSSNSSKEEASTSGIKNLSSSTELEISSDSDTGSTISPILTSIGDQFYSEDCCSKFASNPNLSKLHASYPSLGPLSSSSIDLFSLRDFRSSKEDIFQPQHDCQFVPPIDHLKVTNHQSPLSEIITSGRFGTPQRKRVRFCSPPSNLNDLPSKSKEVPAEKDRGPTQPQPHSLLRQFPLAVKLVFNYEAASNAPAILSALYRELMPARSLQLDDLYSAWKDSFFGSDEHSLLPYHPNLVDMPCAFVDRVPLLEGGLDIYPTALPQRLNPDGWGRNMSLFCVMRRYDLSLAAYLAHRPTLPARTSLLLLAQLLEALCHLAAHHVSHRDLKPDNLLVSLVDGWDSPWLVLTDFGCCLAAGSKRGLHVPFVSREAEPRQGNATLMAPEVKCARPGPFSSVNFSRCDLWAAGTLAYQLYGLPNPFFREGGPSLESGTYKEGQLPGLAGTQAPPAIGRLVADLLRRRPEQRPSPALAATVCQLALWGPSAWLSRHPLARPKHQQVMEWLLSLTAKVICEKRCEGRGAGLTEQRIVSTFLSRVRYRDVLDAINWNKAN